MKKFFALFLAIALVFPVLTAFADDPTSITVAKSSVTLGAGESVSLHYTTDQGNNFPVTASSSNASVVTVSGSSDPVTITAVTAGAATVTLKLDGTEYTSSCAVTVKEAPTIITAGVSSKTLEVKETYKLTAAIGNGYVTKPFKFKSSAPDVASVASDGTITAHKAGTATITVSTSTDSASADCAVTVKAPPSISLDHNKSHMVVDDTMTFTAKDANGDVISGAVFGSSNSAIISVSGSTLTAHAAGTATITATYGGESATKSIVVKNKPTSVTLTPTSVTLKLGGQAQLTASVNDGADTTYTYTTSDMSAACFTVSGSGLIEASKTEAGTGKVTVTTANGLQATVSVKVTADAVTDTPTDKPTDTPAPGTYAATVYTKNGGPLNLRAEMREHADVIASIPNGTKLTITAKGSTWCKTSYNGEVGYVKTSYLKFGSTTDTPTSDPTDTPTPGTYYAKVSTPNKRSVNLREDMDEDAKVLEQIKNDTALTITAKGSKWCKTSYNGKTGYIMTTYLAFYTPTDTPTGDPTDTPTGSPSDTPAPGTYRARVSTKNKLPLYLREEMDKDSSALAKIPNDTELTITAKGAIWCATSYEGKSGYVMTSFLVFVTTPTGSPTDTPTGEPTETPAPGTYSAKVYTKNGGPLNLREQMDDHARVLTTIKHNTWITVTEKGAKWCKTSYNGVTGYVMTSFLVFGDKPTDTPTEAPVTGSFNAKVVTKSGSLNLREAKDEDSKKLTTIPRNTWIVVTEKSSTWCKTSYKGITGYVMTSFLTFGTPPTDTPTDTPTDDPTDTPKPDDTLTPGSFSAQVTTVRGSLNLRKDMNKDSKVLRTIPQYAWITVTGKGSTWCATSYGGYSGYVMTSYLTFGTKPTDPPAETDDPTPTTAQVKTTGGILNLRMSKSESATVLAKIPNKTTLTITVKGTTWCKTSYNGQVGYVMTKFLAFQ